MGGICSTYSRGGKCIHNFGWKTWREEITQSEDLGVDEKIILDRILRETGCESVDWVHLAQDRDQWRAVVNR